LLGPLAERLRTGGAQGVVLIPSGKLGMLPLHAAALEDGRCLLDEFEVSYAPSAQALREARANAEVRAAASFRLAGVGNPLPNPKPLAYAKPELQSVVELLPAGSATPLYEEAATRPALLAALPGATAAHLSCHGNYALDEPLDSGLQLGDGALTLREILDHPEPLATARLAVLSACQTSVTDFRNLPDEAIGLPAGILQAGVPGVIGTLWSVYDESTALLMVRCYEFMLFERMTPCAALRAAQRWLRDLTVAGLETYLGHHAALAQAQRDVVVRMAAALDSRLRERVFIYNEPNMQPFADPIYWAPFTFNGATEVSL
jgi:CHAT domain-containing protein